MITIAFQLLRWAINERETSGKGRVIIATSPGDGMNFIYIGQGRVVAFFRFLRLSYGLTRNRSLGYEERKKKSKE
ncbi:MAG: hypothetical protein HQK96_07790 [Nitrospirae bacterium]|nr:hypothetical protein [Nitrospirota bacterium]